jgi:chemotaxis regulatin CheY-phosphate phosphatase CheZ
VGEGSAYQRPAVHFIDVVSDQAQVDDLLASLGF